MDGVAIVNDYLTKGLVKKGYKVVVVTCKSESTPAEEDHNGIKVYRIYDGDEAKYLAFIKQIVDKEDVLLNVCMQTPTTDILLPYLDEIKCRKKIMYVHGIWTFKWNDNNKESIHNVVSKIYNNAKWRYYYLKVGKYIKKYNNVVQLHEMDDGNLYFKKHYKITSDIMENAADDMFFQKADDSMFLNQCGLSDGYLLCVANYGSGKNQEMVLRAYYQSNASYEMIFIGKDSGGYIDHLKTIEHELQNKTGINYSPDGKCLMKKVRFLQDVPREEIPIFVRNARLFLFGSVGEKFPVSIVEPMAAGVPFISTDVGIVRYFPGGVTVKINDVDAMADQIDKLLADSDKWNRLSEEGRKYAMSRMRIQDKVDQLELILI